MKFTVLEDSGLGAGIHETAGLVVPEWSERICVRMKRFAWPVTDKKYIVRCQVWISYNGGRKFSLLVGFTAAADAMEECSASRRMKPQYKTNDRVVKVIIEAEVPLKTGVELEFS